MMTRSARSPLLASVQALRTATIQSGGLRRGGGSSTAPNPCHLGARYAGAMKTDQAFVGPTSAEHPVRQPHSVLLADEGLDVIDELVLDLEVPGALGDIHD
jgi:hypothetical protein